MDRFKIEAQLRIDEGQVLSVYADSLGKLTCGIGHLLLESDGIPMVVGTPITQEQCDTFFQNDLNHAIAHCEILFQNLLALPEIAQECLVNMTFNLGAGKLATFRHFVAAVKSEDWEEAVAQLENTPWHKQVGARADRIISNFNSLV